MTYEVIPNGHVTSPRGFLAGSVHTGVKKEKDDLVLLISETATTSAAMFTQNLAAAAPVHISREVFDEGDVRAVLVNSGNANACTGSRGEADALELQQITAEMMKMKPQQVALASTGVIGVPLPMDKIRAGIPTVIKACHAQGGPQAAQGIMTTDTIRKEMAVTTVIDGKTVTIGGMAKGSGMINPNMATMLGFITTDAAVELSYLKEAVAAVVEDTYNMITVDGDTSTNDTVMVLANGQAGNKPLNDQHPDKKKFMDALYAVNEALAISIVKDGEGATKLMEVITEGFATKTDARLAAKAVLNSNLVKTAIFGEDGNWGRIVCSLGYSGAAFQLNDVALTLANSRGESVQVLSAGLPLNYSEEKVAELLKDKKVMIRLTAASGEASARGWGCDLSYDYVKINGSYRS